MKARDVAVMGSLVLGVAFLCVGCDSTTDTSLGSDATSGSSSDSTDTPSNDSSSADDSNDSNDSSDSSDSSDTDDTGVDTGASDDPGPDCVCACDTNHAAGGCAEVCNGSDKNPDFCGGDVASPACASCLAGCAGIDPNDPAECY